MWTRGTALPLARQVLGGTSRSVLGGGARPALGGAARPALGGAARPALSGDGSLATQHFTMQRGTYHEPPVQVTELPSGLRVATQETTEPLVAITVFVAVGTRYEAPEEHGAAHFLEHMMFHGTPQRSQAAMEREVELLGGRLEAWTTREYTQYSAECLSRTAPEFVDILGDMLSSPLMDAGAIESERQVILSELKHTEEGVIGALTEYLHETAFAGSSLGHTLLGPPDQIMALDQATLSAFHRTHYTAPRMTVVVSGGAAHGQIVARVSEAFAKLPSTAPAASAARLVRAPTRYVGSDCALYTTQVKDASFSFGFEGLDSAHPDNIVLMLLPQLLGTYSDELPMGAGILPPLARRLASEGLVKSIMPVSLTYSDTGLVALTGTCADPDNLEVTLFTAASELLRLARRGSVTPAELERAITATKLQLLADWGHVLARTNTLGLSLINLGRPLPLHELFARLDLVSPKDISRVCNNLFYDRDHVLAAILPKAKGYYTQSAVPDYNQLRSKLTSRLY